MSPRSSHRPLALLVCLCTIACANPVLAQLPETYAPVAAFGGQGQADGQFFFPSDAAVLDGKLYVADGNNNRIQVFDLDGTFLFKWGSTGTGDGQFRVTRGLGATWYSGPEARIFVGDSKNDRVHAFEPDGTNIINFGSIGQGPLEFFRPRGIDVQSDSTLVICDNDNDRIKRYTKDFELINIFGGNGTGPGLFQRATDVGVAPDDRLFCLDALNNRVQIFSPTGTYQSQWGEGGSGPGQFASPIGLEVDGDGDVYIADTGNNRVQKLSADGTPLAVFGSLGGGLTGMRGPIGITVDDESGRVFVIDTGNHRVVTWDPDTSIPVEARSFSQLKAQFGQ